MDLEHPQGLCMHHARDVRNDGLPTRMTDRRFDCEWSDFSMVQSCAVRGRPLISPRERLGAGKV